MKDDKPEFEIPPLDDLFCMGVSSVIETANLLGFDEGTFLATMRVAWLVDAERRKQEKGEVQS